MRFVGTDFVGTLVGTAPENGLKMGYFGSFFGYLFQVQRHEKCPRCLIFTHLGHFTSGGERGIWTLATLSSPTPLAGEPLHHLGISPAWRMRYPKIMLAERVGFEPTVHCCITSFQDWLLKPLGHLSFRIQLYYYSINRRFCQPLKWKNLYYHDYSVCFIICWIRIHV